MDKHNFPDEKPDEESAKLAADRLLVAACEELKDLRVNMQMLQNEKDEISEKLKESESDRAVLILQVDSIERKL
jgi:hypothetical protein